MGTHFGIRGHPVPRPCSGAAAMRHRPSAFRRATKRGSCRGWKGKAGMPAGGLQLAPCMTSPHERQGRLPKRNMAPEGRYGPWFEPPPGLMRMAKSAAMSPARSRTSPRIGPDPLVVAAGVGKRCRQPAGPVGIMLWVRRARVQPVAPGAKVMRNRVGWHEHSMMPARWAASRLRTTARPMPVPPEARRVVKNGSKIRVSLPAEMPRASSMTSSTIWP